MAATMKGEARGEGAGGGSRGKGKESALHKEAKSFSEKLKKRGVVFIARVPPHMKPNKVQALFEVYGHVTRLFLQEEDAGSAKRRKAAGGNGSRQFREGWVEFEDKKLARRVAESLNNTPMGGKKSSFYHDDLWNLKYLKGFKWDNLTEMQACVKRASESKLQAAMLQAKRQNAEFAELVEKNQVHKHIQDRKRARGHEAGAGAGGGGGGGGGAEGGEAAAKKQRKFKQTAPLGGQGASEPAVDKALLKQFFKRDG